MIIYKLISPSGKIYIGQTKSDLDKRFVQHINSWKRWTTNKSKKGVCTKLFYGFDSYDPESWIKEIIYETNSKEELDTKEIYFIELFDSIQNGYNITKGGNGRKVDFLDEDHKQNISDSRKEYFDTEEGKEWKRIASKRNLGANNPMYGKQFSHSEETKNKMSQNSKGKNKGKIPWNKDKTGIYSEESLKKNSHSAKENHKKGIYSHIDRSLNMKGKSQSDYQKRRASETKSKSWELIDSENNIFVIKSLRKFCIERGFDPGNMSKNRVKGWKCRKLEE
jgi:group I intron endonuclease